MVRKQGIDRLVRLGCGLEEPSDIIACLNWALWHHSSLSQEDVECWQDERTCTRPASESAGGKADSVVIHRRIECHPHGNVVRDRLA